MRMVVVLPRAVGAEEAVDGAALHLHRQVMHDLAAAERLRQALDVDRDVGRARRRVHRLSATGCLGVEIDADRLADAQGIGPRGPRLDQIDELVALIEAVDHGRGVFGRGRDEIDLCGEIGRAIVAGDAAPRRRSQASATPASGTKNRTFMLPGGMIDSTGRCAGTISPSRK